MIRKLSELQLVYAILLSIVLFVLLMWIDSLAR